MIKLLDILSEIISENDPKKGTGKKPKGSDRRLYTDENPSDTVNIKFKTAQDIRDTLSKEASKEKTERLNKLKEDITNKYNLVGNCVTGLDDPYFQRNVCDDATEMAGIVDEYSNEFLTSEEFVKKVNWDENILGIAADNMFEFAFNKDKDIYWAYNIEDDVHFFFIEDRINESYKDYIKVNKLNDYIECNNCDHHWSIVDGGKDPYLCHKCRTDNTPEQLNEKCWTGYKRKGTKTMFGKKYPNCIKKSKK